jgi:hypothetical protein
MASKQQNPTIGPLIQYRSEGIFDHREWMKEGDGLLASARILRAAWLLKRRAFRQQLNTSKRPPDFGKSVILLEGLPKSSMLLLGYAAEMYLKCGLVRIYNHCPEPLFQRDVRKRFGHDLVGLAEEVEFPASSKVREQLRLLRAFIEDEARYPITPHQEVRYITLWNRRAANTQNDRSFREYCRLVRKIDRHVSRIDQDETNPAVFMGVRIGADGFVTLRFGGNLSPRVTYRPSTLLSERGKTTPEDIKALLNDGQHDILVHYWDKAVILEDRLSVNRTFVHPPKDGTR